MSPILDLPPVYTFDYWWNISDVFTLVCRKLGSRSTKRCCFYSFRCKPVSDSRWNPYGRLPADVCGMNCMLESSLRYDCYDAPLWKTCAVINAFALSPPSQVRVMQSMTILYRVKCKNIMNLHFLPSLRGQAGWTGQKQQDERSHVAVVACGPRLEETLTMLKSAVLLSLKPLHFYIFAEDDLHDSFQNAVRDLFDHLFLFFTLLTHVISFLFGSNVSLLMLSLSSTPGPEQSRPGLVSPSTPSRFPVRMGRSGRSFLNLVPLSDSSCQWVYSHPSMNVTSSNGSCENVCSLACTPADPERGGLFTLCGHRHHIPAAGRGNLGPPFTF